MGLWQDARGANLLDGAAPFYCTYEAADGRYVAVGALEPKFYAALLDGLGLAADDLPPQYDRDQWPELERRLAATFRERTRDEWAEIFAGTDACVAPVLAPAEAPLHPHLAARRTFTEVDGVTQPAPAPRFDRTPGEIAGPPPLPGAHTAQVLADWGFEPGEIEALRSGGAIA
jgi:alpha-methylacyl-CoA racemase